jgi:hypothetical protein
MLDTNRIIREEIRDHVVLNEAQKIMGLRDLADMISRMSPEYNSEIMFKILHNVFKQGGDRKVMNIF